MKNKTKIKSSKLLLSVWGLCVVLFGFDVAYFSNAEGSDNVSGTALEQESVIEEGEVEEDTGEDEETEGEETEGEETEGEETDDEETEGEETEGEETEGEETEGEETEGEETDDEETDDEETDDEETDDEETDDEEEEVADEKDEGQEEEEEIDGEEKQEGGDEGEEVVDQEEGDEDEEAVEEEEMSCEEKCRLECNYYDIEIVEEEIDEGIDEIEEEETEQEGEESVEEDENGEEEDEVEEMEQETEEIEEETVIPGEETEETEEETEQGQEEPEQAEEDAVNEEEDSKDEGEEAEEDEKATDEIEEEAEVKDADEKTEEEKENAGESEEGSEDSQEKKEIGNKMDKNNKKESIVRCYEKCMEKCLAERGEVEEEVSDDEKEKPKEEIQDIQVPEKLKIEEDIEEEEKEEEDPREAYGGTNSFTTTKKEYSFVEEFEERLKVKNKERKLKLLRNFIRKYYADGLYEESFDPVCPNIYYFEKLNNEDLDEEEEEKVDREGGDEDIGEETEEKEEKYNIKERMEKEKKMHVVSKNVGFLEEEGLFFVNLTFSHKLYLDNLRRSSFVVEDGEGIQLVPNVVFVSDKEVILVFEAQKRPEVFFVRLDELKAKTEDEEVPEDGELDGYIPLEDVSDEYIDKTKTIRNTYEAYISDDVNFSASRLSFGKFHNMIETDSTIAIEMSGYDTVSDECMILAFGNDLKNEVDENSNIPAAGLTLLSKSSGELPVDQSVVSSFEKEKQKGFLGFVYLKDLEIIEEKAVLYLNLTVPAGTAKGKYQTVMSFELFCPAQQ